MWIFSEDADVSVADTTRAHTFSTNKSATPFSPALSNAIVSLLPSMAVRALPNFWWKTRSPSVKSEIVPVDFATSSPSIVSGRRRGAAFVAGPAYSAASAFARKGTAATTAPAAAS